MNQINNYSPHRTKMTWKDKLFWSGIALVAMSSLTMVFVSYNYSNKIVGVYALEKVRVEKERDQIMQEKCFERLDEYEAKFKLFASKNNVAYDNLFDAADNKQDPLHEEANMLRVEEKLIKDACDEARTELFTVKEASELEFFKSNWRLLFK